MKAKYMLDHFVFTTLINIQLKLNIHVEFFFLKNFLIRMENRTTAYA